jgi:hypothetical protein
VIKAVSNSEIDIGFNTSIDQIISDVGGYNDIIIPVPLAIDAAVPSLSFALNEGVGNMQTVILTELAQSRAVGVLFFSSGAAHQSGDRYGTKTSIEVAEDDGGGKTMTRAHAAVDIRVEGVDGVAVVHANRSMSHDNAQLPLSAFQENPNIGNDETRRHDVNCGFHDSGKLVLNPKLDTELTALRGRGNKNGVMLGA